jgi:transketolase
VHGSPLGDEDLANVKKKLGLDPAQKFHVPEEVRACFGVLVWLIAQRVLSLPGLQVRNFYSKFVTKGEELQKQWEELFEAYAQKYPELAAEFRRRMAGDLPEVNFHSPDRPVLSLAYWFISHFNIHSAGLGGCSSSEQAWRCRGGHQEVLW